MTSIGAIGRASHAIAIGAFVASACGGATPTAAPTLAATAAPQTFAPTAAPVTPAPTVVITLAPGGATAAPGASAEVDPSDALKIGPPYTFEPLDPALAEVFISAMEESLGSMSSLFQVGVKSAVANGESAAWVIVMRFPDVPISGDTLLDAAAEGAAGQGEIEELEIGGQAVRIIEAEGLFSVLTMVNGDLVMSISGQRADGVAVTTSIIQAN